MVVAAAQRAEAIHEVELNRVGRDMSGLLAERNPHSKKLGSLESVEDALREMVVQMKVGRQMGWRPGYCSNSL